MTTVMNFLILIELQIYTLLVTSDVDAKNRIRSFNEFSKINLNAIRRAGMHDDMMMEFLMTVSLVVMKSLMMKLPLLIAKRM